MKKPYSLFTTVLIFVFSANTVFAENTVFNIEEAAKGYSDDLKQVQNKGIEAKSAILDAVVNAANESERLRKVKEEIKRKRSRRPKNRPPGKRNPVSNRPEETIQQKFERLKRDGKMKAYTPPKSSALHRNAESSSGKKLTISQVREIFYPGISTKRLNWQQRRKVIENYNWLLKNRVTLAFLIAVLRTEGALSPKTVVGGIKTKSPGCRKLIQKLNLSSHAVEQGLPQPCFLRTSAGPSTAYGYFQFVYYRTWRSLKKQLGFKNFSRKTQAKGALELARRSGNGSGFIALVTGDLHSAIKKSTGDWAGSEFSKLPGAKKPTLKYAREEYRKLRDKSYYQQWLDEFTNDRSY